MAGYSVTYSVVDNATKQIDAINKRITQMRAPLDRMSRSISRFVDVSGLRKVAEGFGWIARAGAAAFRSLMAIVPVLGAITSAATIAGMAKLVSSFSAWGRDLAIAADQIGIAPQKLQQFEDAARLAGGSADDMRQSLQGLKDTATRALEGQDPMGMAYFNQLGINLRDANGQMRSAADLLPEVMQKLEAIEDPTDRARKATALLGEAGAKMVESLRASGKSWGEWMTDASKFTELAQAQLQDMIKFEQAQGRLGVAFDHLGQQVAAVLARDFGPLLTKLSEFVEKHTPDVIRAVDALSTRFTQWLDKPDTWKNINDGTTKMLDGLKWVIDNLDTVVRVAEDIAILFAVKWAVGIVASIAQVVAALGAVGGTGLLGALGTVSVVAGALAAIFATWAGNKAGQQSIENQAKGMGFEQKSGGWFGMPTFHNPTTGEDLSYEQMLERQGRPHGRSGAQRWLFGPDKPGGQEVKPPASLNLPQDTVQRGAATSARLATDLNLSGPQAAGIVGNLQAESGLQAVQERNPIGGGRGGIGWAQWTGPRRDEFEAYAKENKLDPKSDEANYGFLLKELHSPGSAKLLEQLRALKGPDAARQAAALVEHEYERPEASNAGVRGQYAEQIAKGLPVPPTPPAPVPPAIVPPVAAAPPAPPVLPALPESLRLAAQPPPAATAPPVASAPPVAMPPPAPPVNGAVDVSITHRNPPPNAAVTATGSGSVNVAPPRVEHAALADI